jgi:hypothetical protein
MGSHDEETRFNALKHARLDYRCGRSNLSMRCGAAQASIHECGHIVPSRCRRRRRKRWWWSAQWPRRHAGMHCRLPRTATFPRISEFCQTSTRYDAPGSIAEGWVIVEHGRNQRSSAVSGNRPRTNSKALWQVFIFRPRLRPSPIVEGVQSMSTSKTEVEPKRQ